MSIHKSLKVRSQLVRARNVWTRVERINKLEEDGKYGQGESVFGLPKVKTRIKVRTKKGAKAAAASAKESTDEE